MPTLEPTALQALADGNHSAPFDVLGLHPLASAEAPGRVVRALLPWAREVSMRLEDGRSFALAQCHPAGVFEAVLEAETGWPPYVFDVLDWSGRTVEVRDPYRFGPVLDEGRLLHFHNGGEIRAWEVLGANPVSHEGFEGTVFSVWAPAARAVSVVGSFNGWDSRVHLMRPRGASGTWEIFLPGVTAGALYKFSVLTQAGHRTEKSDPFARSMEMRPRSASVVVQDRGFEWSDGDWVASRTARNPHDSPVSIYEVHLGSWRRNPDPEGNGEWFWLSYRELAERLLPYVAEMGFTHIELLPITEHPFDGSWGYQTLGYFAPTSRFGGADDFRHFVDRAHELGLGVILDWVPAHFPTDAHGLASFDGTHLFEHADPRKGQHPDWGTLVFNYGRNEVAAFLLSSAMYWIESFHIDGLRVDAVASMLYLDYSRKEGEWIPNVYGGRENLEAITFLKRFNGAVHTEHPGVVTFAEESTAWPGVTTPIESGGLGFDLKWNMGWMNDTLDYVEHDAIFRRHLHDRLTFSLVYAFSEHFLLPLSHDEVVHGKRSLLSKMPGYDPDRVANLRALYTYMWTHPGKKLLFMGCELGQWGEWNHEASLDWHLLEQPLHAGIRDLVTALNHVMAANPSLYERDFDGDGFEWIDCHDADHSTLSYLRWSRDWQEAAVIAVNFTPMRWDNYRIGLPFGGRWNLVVNSSDPAFSGAHPLDPDAGNAVEETWHGRPAHLCFDLPPLSAVVFVARREG